jgi:hypothetical protein
VELRIVQSPKSRERCANRREHGVQIGQSIDAHKIYGRQIADAVADVIGPMIEVCMVPVFERSNHWTCLIR